MKGCFTSFLSSVVAGAIAAGLLKLLDPGFNGEKRSLAVTLGVIFLLMGGAVAYRRWRSRQTYRG